MSAIKVGDRVRVLPGCKSATVGEEFIVTRITYPSNTSEPSLGTWYAMGDSEGRGVWGVYLEKIETREDLLAEIAKLQAQVADLKAQLVQPEPILVDFTDSALAGLQRAISDAIANGMVEASVWQGRN